MSDAVDRAVPQRPVSVTWVMFGEMLPANIYHEHWAVQGWVTPVVTRLVHGSVTASGLISLQWTHTDFSTVIFTQ